MLPIIDKPLIQYSVEDAYNSGIRHIIFVTGRNKRSIEDHFDDNPELRRSLEIDKKNELLMEVNSIAPADLKFSYVRQANPKGLGHAILCAQHLIFDDFFSIILPDDLLIQNPPSCMKWLKFVKIQMPMSLLLERLMKKSFINMELFRLITIRMN